MDKIPSRSRRRFVAGVAASAVAVAWAPRYALAADPLKIGLILPLTGPFASTGRQVEAACRLYMARNGDSAAGRKVELIVKDDTGLAPETTKRIAQDMIVQDHVAVIAGFGLTPLALATAPVATEAQYADDRHGGRDIDHPATLALYRPLGVRAAADHGAHRRLGRQRTRSRP